MEIKNGLGKYTNITSENSPSTKQFAPEFNHPLKRKLTNETIEKIIRKHTNQITGITHKQAEVARSLEEATKQFVAMKRLFWAFIGMAGLVIIGWIFETYYHFWEVKAEYIHQTEQLQNTISEQKRETENIKKDNENLQEEVKYLRSRIDTLQTSISGNALINGSRIAK